VSSTPPKQRFIDGPLEGLLKTLDGDEVFMYIDERRDAVYQRLPSGHYKFVRWQAKAPKENPDGLPVQSSMQ
jgi:hypothetical protein